MSFKAILFDIDGTLVDSNDYHVFAWIDAFSSIGVDLSFEEIHAQIGKGKDMLVPTLMPGATEATIEKLGTVHDDVFKSRYLKRVKDFEDAANLLHRAYDAGLRVVLASSASEDELNHYVALLDVKSILAAVTTADDVENTKPAPDIFTVALKKIAPLSAAEVVVIGDSPFDILAARRGGIDTIAVRSGKFADDVLRRERPIAIYDGVGTILKRFDQLLLTAR